MALSIGGPKPVLVSIQPRVLSRKESPIEYGDESSGLRFGSESLSAVEGAVVGAQKTPMRCSDVVEATSDHTPPVQCT